MAEGVCNGSQVCWNSPFTFIAAGEWKPSKNRPDPVHCVWRHRLEQVGFGNELAGRRIAPPGLIIRVEAMLSNRQLIRQFVSRIVLERCISFPGAYAVPF